MKAFYSYQILVFSSLTWFLLGFDARAAEYRLAADNKTLVDRNEAAFGSKLSAIKALLSSKEVTNQIRGLISVGHLATDNKPRLQSEPQIIVRLENLYRATNNDVVLSALAALVHIESPRSVPIFKAALASTDKRQHLFGAHALLEMSSSGKENIETAVDKLVTIILDASGTEEADDVLVGSAFTILERLDTKAKLGFPNYVNSLPSQIKEQRLTPKEWNTRPDLIAIRKKYQESVRKWWTEKRPEIISRILSANADGKN